MPRRTSEKGFTLIELLIVVAIIAIIAAIAIPALLRARIAANEAAAIGDMRTVGSASSSYYVANGGFYDDELTCLSGPVGCIPNYPTNAPTFLDSQLASLLPKQGYSRSYQGGDHSVDRPAQLVSFERGILRLLGDSHRRCADRREGLRHRRQRAHLLQPERRGSRAPPATSPSTRPESTAPSCSQG